MDQYLPVLLLLVLALVFAAGSFAASKLLGPTSRHNPAKLGPYESGIAPRREPATRFPVRFYLVAMIFIIFDIEIVFLYPFAVMFRQLALFGLVEIATFAVVVFIAFAYLVSEGALDWGPGKRLGSRSGAPVARSLNATIRRVGRPGVPAQHPAVPSGKGGH
jgi:NADH-quinone oxidoreductase subunit A